MEQSGGLIYELEYDQLCTWLAYNCLDPFLESRDEDLRNAQLLSKLHNVNTTKESHLTSPKDFMPLSVDQIIEKEIELKELENNPQDARETAIHEFNSHVAHLKSIGRPVQTIKVS